MKNDLKKRKKLIETVFMILILGLFIAFLVLWLKVDSMLPRYIVGAALLAAAFVYKAVDKNLDGEEEQQKNSHDESKKDAQKRI